MFDRNPYYDQFPDELDKLGDMICNDDQDGIIDFLGKNPQIKMAIAADPDLAFIVAFSKPIQMLQILRCHGLNLDAQNEEGMTALNQIAGFPYLKGLSAEELNLEMIRRSERIILLLTWGANPNIPNKYGQLPIHGAARKKNEHAIRGLSLSNVQFNAVCHAGMTPLHYLLLEEVDFADPHFNACLKFLLGYGVGQNTKTTVGVTPRDMLLYWVSQKLGRPICD